MTPFRYRGRVIGIAAYERALANELQRVRELGQKNRANVADPEKNSRPGVWFDHCDDDVNPYEVSFLFLPLQIGKLTKSSFFSLVSVKIGSGICRPNLISAPSRSSSIIRLMRATGFSRTRALPIRG